MACTTLFGLEDRQIRYPCLVPTRRIGPRNAPAGTHVRREAVEGPYGMQRHSRFETCLIKMIHDHQVVLAESLRPSPTKSYRREGDRPRST
jgi:hypothetical protein